uniref:Uncharacterized protein n=1 Tax=Romanomermis culicivorax TaxID=13658 RepID=A0A915HSM2_ROMCU
MLVQVIINSSTNPLTKSLTRFRQQIKNGWKALGNLKNEVTEISSTNWKILLTKFSSASRNRPLMKSSFDDVYVNAKEYDDIPQE